MSTVFAIISQQCLLANMAKALVKTGLVCVKLLVSISSVTVRKLNAISWKVARVQKYFLGFSSIQVLI